MRPLLNIIIPVFHTEQYLSRCIDSCLEQDLQDFELIIVDDCSKAECQKIYEKYKIDHTNIHYIRHSSNLGLLSQSYHHAPVDEVMAIVDLYKGRYSGWNVMHFYSFYQREHTGKRSYGWVKDMLQQRGVVKKGRRRGPHRKRREPAALAGMLVHQDGSTHEWVAGQYWDLIVTMDDATNEHYSMFFVDEEGTSSSFQGIYLCTDPFNGI